MEARAITRYVRVSPRKARIVLDQIRGKNVVKAQETLRFTIARLQRSSRKRLTLLLLMQRRRVSLTPIVSW